MIKKGVKSKGIQPEILLAIQEAREVYHQLGAETVITSLLDGKHMKGSKHYEGQAVDLRIRHLHDPQLAFSLLRSALGRDYDVVLEKSHIHVEFDPK